MSRKKTHKKTQCIHKFIKGAKEREASYLAIVTEMYELNRESYLDAVRNETKGKPTVWRDSSARKRSSELFDELAIGGKVQLEFFEGENYDQIRSRPSSPSARDAVAKIVAFIRGHAN